MSVPPQKRRRSSNYSQLHEWPLGALSELVVTASAASTSLHINASSSPSSFISLLDNGPGHPSTTLTALTIPSPWRTAALRIGTSLVLLTTLSDGTATAAVLTNPPHIFNWSAMSPQHPHLPKLLQASPWQSYQQVASAFDSIHASGSLLVISELTLHPERSQTTELDFSDPHDIAYSCTSNFRFTSSLRTYLELLFLRPKARIHIRGRIVRERRLGATMWGRTDFLYAPRTTTHSAASMRFGFDPHATGEQFGMLLYCRGRLIRPYLKVGLQVHQNSHVRVVGIVEADFLTPTANMQNFERDKLYQGLMFSLDRSLKTFWNKYGSMQKVLQTHSQDVVRKWCRCDHCGYWRIVVGGEGVPDPHDISCLRWVCEMNLGGTVKCGAPDDDDVVVNVGNRRIMGAVKSKPELSVRFKKPRSSSFIQPGTLRDASHAMSAGSSENRLRLPRVRTPNWPINSLGEGSTRSSPTTIARVAVAKITAREMATPNVHLVREPNLDLDQPTPELVSPELHFTGDEFSLSRNDITVPPVSSPSNLQNSTPPMIPSPQGSPTIMYGQIEAFLKNVEAKDVSLHGEVSLLNKNLMRMNKTPEPIRNSVANEIEQKRSLGIDTLKSSSSVTHDDVYKSDGVNDKVLNLMATTSDKIYVNRTVLDKRHSQKAMTISRTPPSRLTPKQTPKNGAREQLTSSRGYLSLPFNTSQRRVTELRDSFQPVVPTRAQGMETGSMHASEARDLGSEGGRNCASPNGIPGSIDGGKSRMGSAEIIGAKRKMGSESLITPPNYPSRLDSSKLGSSDSKDASGTPRYGGYRYVRGSKGKGRLGTGSSPQQAAVEEREGNAGVTTSSALAASARFDGNDQSSAGIEPSADVILRTSVGKDGSNRAFGNDQHGNSFLSSANVHQEKYRTSREQNYKGLHGSSLEGMDVDKILGFNGGAGLRPPSMPLRLERQGGETGADVRARKTAEEFLLEKAGKQSSTANAVIAEEEAYQMPMVQRKAQVERAIFENKAPLGDSEPADIEGTLEESFERDCKSTKNNVLSGDRVSPGADTAETTCESLDGRLHGKRRLEDDPSSGDNANVSSLLLQDIASAPDICANKEPTTESRHGPRTEKRRRVEEDTLAIATQAAKSAAQFAFGDVENPQMSPSSNLPMQMTWSQIALSAAVAAGAAAAAATTAKQSMHHHSLQSSLAREHETAISSENERKLRKIISHLVPSADEKTLDEIHSLDAERAAKEVKNCIKRDAKDELEREMSQQLESCHLKLQTEAKSLQKIRKLVHVFLDQVVGILETDDSHEPVENQMENYLRLVDAWPTDN